MMKHRQQQQSEYCSKMKELLCKPFLNHEQLNRVGGYGQGSDLGEDDHQAGYLGMEVVPCALAFYKGEGHLKPASRQAFHIIRPKDFFTTKLLKTV